MPRYTEMLGSLKAESPVFTRTHFSLLFCTVNHFKYLPLLGERSNLFGIKWIVNHHLCPAGHLYQDKMNVLHFVYSLLYNPQYWARKYYRKVFMILVNESKKNNILNFMEYNIKNG